MGNLPGTEDTVINQAVPSGGGSGIALSRVEACDLPKRGRLGCAIFGSGGLRSRIPRTMLSKAATCTLTIVCVQEKEVICCCPQTQAVQEKQAMVYSLQRKLKSSRQALESRDLQVSLFQRKACGLEERMAEVVKKEAEMNAVLDRVSE